MYLKMKNVQFRSERKNCSEIFPEEYSHLYLGIEGKLAAVICIEDPLRPEAPEVVKALRKSGVHTDRYDDR